MVWLVPVIVPLRPLRFVDGLDVALAIRAVVSVRMRSSSTLAGLSRGSWSAILSPAQPAEVPEPGLARLLPDIM